MGNYEYILIVNMFSESTLHNWAGELSVRELEMRNVTSLTVMDPR